MTAVQHAIAVIAIALVGLGAFATFGDAMQSAIAGSSSRQTVGRAIPASPLSRQAALEDIVRVGRELYRNIPLELELTDSRWAETLDPHVEAMGEVGLSVDEFAARLGVSDAEAQLLYGLYEEFFQLRDEGLFQTGVYGTAPEVSATQSTLRALGAVPFKILPAYSQVTDELNRARFYFRRERLPVPKQFFDRIEAAARIYRGGIDETTRAAVFDGVRFRNVSLTAEFLGRYESPPVSAAEFALRYQTDPVAALALVPEAGRAYLQAEILPFFETSTFFSGGEDEGAIVGAIISGDGVGLRSLLAPNPERSATVSPEAAAAMRFAAALFGGNRPEVVPFSTAEAEALLRYPGIDFEALRARESGGAPMAALVEAVANTDFKRLPGRSATHENHALEALLRTVARGDANAFERLEIILSNIVQEVPLDLSRSMREILESFEGALPQ